MTDAEQLELMEMEREHEAHLASQGASQGGGVPPQAPPPPTPGIGQALTMGGAQGLSYNHADETAGLLGKLKGLEYEKGRDFYRANDKAAREAHPWLYGGAQLAGGIVSPVNKILGPIKGAHFLANAAKTALSGAAEGMGASEGHSPWEVLKDSALGMAFGLAGNAVSHGAAAMVPTAKTAATTAQDWAWRHLRPTPKVAQVIGKEEGRKIGQESLDSGALKFWNKAESTDQALQDLIEDRGKKIQGHIDKATKTTSIGDINKKIESEVIAPLEGTEADQGLVESLRARLKKLEAYYDGKPMTAKMVEQEKRRINKYIQKSYGQLDLTPSQEAEMARANVFKSVGEGLIDSPEFLADKASYGRLSKAQLMTGRTASLTDGGTGLMGHMGDLTASHLAIQALLHGNPAGVGIGIGRALTKGRGASSIAAVADKTAKFMATHPYLDKGANLLRSGIQQTVPVLGRQSPWELMK